MIFENEWAKTLRSHILSFFKILSLVFFFWISKLFQISAAQFFGLQSFLLFLFQIFALIICFKYLFTYNWLGANSVHFICIKSFKRISAIIFLFSALMFVPFIPDVYFAFAQESSHAFFYSLLSLFVISICSLVPRALTYLIYRFTFIFSERKKYPLFLFLQKFKLLNGILICLILMCELSIFLCIPFAGFGGIPLPIPFPSDSAMQRASFQKAQFKESMVVLLDPQQTTQNRLALWKSGGQAGQEYLALKVSKALESIEWQKYERIIIVFPETAIFGNANIDWARVLKADPKIYSSLQKFWFVTGVQTGASNVVHFWGENPVSFMPMNGLLNQKKYGVPFFESQFLGLSLRNLEKEPGEQIINIGTLNFNGMAQNFFPLRGGQVLICMDALKLEYWVRSQPRLVLTNHEPFKKFLITSAVYDVQIRTFAALFSSPLALVSNKGTTGFFSRGSNLEHDFLAVQL